MKVIILDAGHGGSDSGAINEGLPDIIGDETEEEDITLEVILALGNTLTNRGYDVKYTRIFDEYISPANRLKFIQDMEPDCFISIHCNSSTNEYARGIETIYRDSYDYPLAASIHKSLIAETELKDRGIKNDEKGLKRRLAVLSDLETPACLVELGFLSNEEDLDYMKNNWPIMVEAIAEGVDAWSLTY